jgi:hypothetical protein
MADFSSALPIRSELVGQVVYQDIITKLGDATNPTTQQAEVDTFGSQFSVLRDIAGNAIGDQLISASYWLQVVMPSNGPAAPGTASAYSDLAGGIYNATPETLTNGQQSALQLNSSGYLYIAATPASLGYDTNFGVVGASTLRTASEIGNSTGAANFNYGAVGAQTLRVAAQVGNATGAADFGAGATDAQTLRVTANQGVAAATAGAWPMEVTDGTNVAGVAPASTAATAIQPALVVALSPGSPLPAGTNLLGSVNQGTSPWVVKDVADGSVSGGTAGTFSMLAGGVYNSAGITLTNGQQASLQLDVNGYLEVDLKTPIPAGANLIGAVNLDVGSAPVSNTNPVPVSVVSTTPGTAIQSYYTSVALAAAASATFTYTVVATHTFNLERVWASSSVKIKIVVANNGTTIFAGFNSTANPNVDITVIAPPTIAAGNTVTVTITNLDLIAADVYATIEGNQN